MSSNLPSLEKLDFEGDSASLGQRWDKWKRSLYIYLEATEVTTPLKKRATLLLLGGSGLQDIFYNLPGANVDPNENNDVFKIAIQKLDDYFTPKQSKVYERHLFRLLKQDEGEKFEKFLVRLRHQAEKCRFDKPEHHLIDQIAEKCLSVDLRKKILTIGDSITLEKIITEANTLEVVTRQLEEYGQDAKNQEVNALFRNEDSLSRLCKTSDCYKTKGHDHVHHIVENARPMAVSMADLENQSSEDPEILNVKTGINSNAWDDSAKPYKIFETELCFFGNILLRGNRLVIPSNLRKRVLDAAHEGHPGIVAMKGRLRSKVWWPRIDKDAENLVKSCKGCTLVGLPNPPVPMKRRSLPEAPWVDVAIDLLGPLPSNEYILVIVDYYSRYKEVKITKNITSTQIIKLLKEIFSRLGYPSSITADNGRQFVSEEFKGFCDECNIKLFHTIPYWPQQNGEVERQNRDILKRLKIGKIEKKNLQETLWEYLMMYNSTPHSVTGKTPSDLFFKRQNRDKIPAIQDINKEDDSEVRDRDMEKKGKGKEYADKRRGANNLDLNEGEKVYIKEMDKGNKLTTNYNPTPHIVERAKDGDVTVRNEETGQMLRRNVVHLKRVEGQWKAIKGTEETEQNLEYD
ncbi:uncharacterized protein K02A2.6-like [Aricia agestis]|uniref:uncharacterized protein K02A2.6-like n=1 Tax=Aricia agestis TaxID=91739 RepID=UPI001C20C2B9|nr:uncharacterized protein K02A2.6-like [Aricia agestis]